MTVRGAPSCIWEMIVMTKYTLKDMSTGDVTEHLSTSDLEYELGASFEPETFDTIDRLLLKLEAKEDYSEEAAYLNILIETEEQ